jgi:septation ring formation regulator EzrA
MADKQVIMSKVEFDNMEKELNDLRNVVESKTVCRIAYPKLYWGNIYGRASEIGSYEVEYVIGSDENEVVKELSTELEKERKHVDELEAKMDTILNDMHAFQRQKDDWKHLPWYKRLFV